MTYRLTRKYSTMPFPFTSKSLRTVGIHTGAPIPPKKRHNRSRNIIWFNPPFSMNVKTNIGQSFLNLVKKHFPPESVLHKIFNRNTIKISYCCMNNFQQTIISHNKALLNKNVKEVFNKDSCNCRIKALCPVPEKCPLPCSLPSHRLYK